MAVENHLAELERRRLALKRKIEVCEQHPSIDQLKLASLKRQKLRIKDEVERLRQSMPAKKGALTA